MFRQDSESIIVAGCSGPCPNTTVILTASVKYRHIWTTVALSDFTTCDVIHVHSCNSHAS